MSGLFMEIVNMSLAATVIGLLIGLLRKLLKRRLPRWVFYLTWAAVLVRLLAPVTFPSPVSVFNAIPAARVEQSSGGALSFVEDTGVKIAFPTLKIDEASQQEKPVIAPSPIPVVTILTSIWLCGVAFLIGYSLLCYVYTLTRLRGADRAILPPDEAARIFEMTGVAQSRVQICRSALFNGPVVCGLFRPKLVFPDSVGKEQLPYVLAHELTHIRRHDNFWKAAATLALYVHWFNPIMWWLYRLYVIDMETSCDEAVVRRGYAGSREYATCLLEMASRNANVLTGGFLAFGESALKERVQAVMHVRKATVFLSIICCAVLSGLGVIFLTNPQALPSPPSAEQSSPERLSPVPAALEGLQEGLIYSASVEEGARTWWLPDDAGTGLVSWLTGLPLNHPLLVKPEIPDGGATLFINFRQGGGFRLRLSGSYLEVQGTLDGLQGDRAYWFQLSQEEADEALSWLHAMDKGQGAAAESQDASTGGMAPAESGAASSAGIPLEPQPDPAESAPQAVGETPADEAVSAPDREGSSSDEAETKPDKEALVFYEDNPAYLKIDPSQVLFAAMADRETHRGVLLETEQIIQVAQLLNALPPRERQAQEPDPSGVRLLQISLKDGTRYLYWIHNNVMLGWESVLADSLEVDGLRRFADSVLSRAGRNGTMGAEWLLLMNPYRVTQMELYLGQGNMDGHDGKAGGMAIYSADVSEGQRQAILELATRLKALPALEENPVEREGSPDYSGSDVSLALEIRLQFGKDGESYVVYLFQDGTMYITSSMSYYTAYKVPLGAERRALLDTASHLVK